MALTTENLKELVARIRTLPPDKEKLQDQLVDLARLLESLYCEPMLVADCIDQLSDKVIRETMTCIVDELPLKINDPDPRVEFLVQWRFDTRA